MIVCLNPSTGKKRVQHNYNTGYRSFLLDSTNPSIGISSAIVIENNKGLNCSFTLQNSNSNRKYFNLSANNPFIIAAYGHIDANSGGKLWS